MNAMKRKSATRPLCGLALMMVIPSATWSAEYTFEAGFGYERSETSIRDTGFAAIPPGPVPSLFIDTESSAFEVTGTWFFDGLSDARGPRSRAAFVDRASSLTVLLGDTSSDTDSVLRFPPGGPPDIRDSFDTDGNSIALSGRYVFESSGWFVTGEFGQLEFDSFGAGAEVDVFGAGFGKYIGETTTLALSAARAEIDVSGGGGDDTDNGLILAFDHIGGDPSGMQYGVAATVSNQSLEGSSGSYSVRGSLYPNRDVTLNVSVSGQLGSDPIDATVFAIDGGWFFSEAFEVSVGYTFTRFDEQEDVDIDDDGFRLAARYRF